MISSIYFTGTSMADEAKSVSIGNFGLPGLIDLPTANTLPDGEIVVTQQLHESLARSGMSFQIFPNLGVAFRYSGHGKNGGEANGRVNHDRSFDAHLTLWNEGDYLPGTAIGLRDFIGTGWYSSEYIVATKSIGAFELTGGLGFGRLAGRNTFKNPLAAIDSSFETRDANDFGRGGTLGTINWFQGRASTFGGLSYRLGDRIALAAEYTPDLMGTEKRYLSVKSPWNVGASYQVNNTLSLSAQYLHGSTSSITANFALNPTRPPHDAGRETAPVPFRARGGGAPVVEQTDEATIRKVFEVDGFEVLSLRQNKDYIRVDLENTKYRSIAQALGRTTSTLQRFTADEIKRAVIVFHKDGLQLSSYTVDLERVTPEQFGVPSEDPYMIEGDVEKIDTGSGSQNQLSWGLGPYITHRLFNPDLPLSVELGAELSAKYKVTPKLTLDGAFRKSVLTNFTENKRLGGASAGVPVVQSDWGYYDIEGQDGHIDHLSLDYVDNLAPAVFGRAHAGILEPFWSGVGGEALYMPVGAPIALGVDLHHVRKRDYDMLFDLRDYETTTGHVSAYLDAGGMFDLEVNAGRYLAQDWGATTRISRQFSNGWEVGGYATLTDIPFNQFGEGSFDKGIYVMIPMDWLTGEPEQSTRYFEIRPITRDGGARLGSARKLYRQVKSARDTQMKREAGRMWK